jgi:hypothetical protein
VNGKSLKTPGGRWVESCNQPGKPARGDLPERRGSALVSGGVVMKLAERFGLVVRYGRQRLADILQLAGGLNFGAVAQAVRRFAGGLAKDAEKVRFLENIPPRLLAVGQGAGG